MTWECFSSSNNRTKNLLTYLKFDFIYTRLSKKSTSIKPCVCVFELCEGLNTVWGYKRDAWLVDRKIKQNRWSNFWESSLVFKKKANLSLYRVLSIAEVDMVHNWTTFDTINDIETILESHTIDNVTAIVLYDT